MTNVILYGKKDCEKCEAAKEKLQLLGFRYQVKDLAEAVAPTDDWRANLDEKLDVLAASQEYGPTSVPLIAVNGHVTSYPLAMGILKRLRKVRDR